MTALLDELEQALIAQQQCVVRPKRNNKHHRYLTSRVLTAVLFDALLFGAISISLTAFTGNVAVSKRLQPTVGEEPANLASAPSTITIPDSKVPLAENLEGAPSPENDPTTVIVLRSNSAPDSEASSVEKIDETDIARHFLIETATPGDTMTRQGPELAIGRLHPEFVRRLAGAIRDAREAGLRSAGIFSAYRPPAFGVGGFSDKFNSLHTYGLAVDMTGIGGPGTQDTKLWYEIAARHGVVCPYGAANRVEWNHCQPTQIKIIMPESPLRETLAAAGPVNLQSMFVAGSPFIESEANASDFVASEAFELAGTRHDDATNKRPIHWTPELIKLDHLLKAESQLLARHGRPAWCSHLHRPRKDTCGTSHETVIGKKPQNEHPRQASASLLREGRKL
jgi:hypothetical protein